MEVWRVRQQVWDAQSNKQEFGFTPNLWASCQPAVNAKWDQIWWQKHKAGKGPGHRCPLGIGKRNERGHVRTEGRAENSSKPDLSLGGFPVCAAAHCRLSGGNVKGCSEDTISSFRQNRLYKERWPNLSLCPLKLFFPPPFLFSSTSIWSVPSPRQAVHPGSSSLLLQQTSTEPVYPAPCYL